MSNKVILKIVLSSVVIPLMIMVMLVGTVGIISIGRENAGFTFLSMVYDNDMLFLVILPVDTDKALRQFKIVFYILEDYRIFISRFCNSENSY